MAEKKDPFRFTVMFNRMDPNHSRVTEILNQQGHRKAQFIVNAVLSYMVGVERPTITKLAPVDKQAILEIVMQYLEEREQGGAEARAIQTPSAAKQSQPAKKEMHIHTGESTLSEAEALLGEDGLAAIADTMASFLRK